MKKFERHTFLIVSLILVVCALLMDDEMSFMCLLAAVLTAGLWNSEMRKFAAQQEQARKSAVLQRLTNGRVK